ncbi:patatin-like phospholipase family protein [Tomitella gaofuii]|uniref:patatin-like phospholipase family protein n=1 Tax=Tomitella gaofuii TaxID=2760083 RepID=UPI0015FCBE48|nr:patatin-like phospholipase family protein [Tomitella gaofuii]
MTLAVVLGGGGVAGIAWEVGVIAGLAEVGVHLGGVSRIVGTSAGSVVGASLAAGVDVAELLEQQRHPRTSGGDGARADRAPLTADADAWAELLGTPGPRDELLRRMGALARAAQTVPEGPYVASMAAMVPGAWPQDVDLRVTGVDAQTGAVRVWDRHSGVAIEEAVAASCAVPGIFPLVTVDGRQYFDGGMASPTHAGQAAGCTEVLVVAPFTVSLVGPGLDAELAELGAAVRSAVIDPDAASLNAIGVDPMDPSTRGPAAEAGLRQGRAEAMRVGIALSL